jgi:hypothetical protein
VSLLSHVAVLGVLLLDLALGGAVVERLGGRIAMTGFEFAIILGYVLFVLQWLPWRNRS